ncbi:hypothetical protein PMAYCL1PPCAC_33064 [Pristionchus mayeri]|uniref:UDP-glucuronosyltransferase n=1 Tax=Pristionchus mayeri TaxID=1317129 RepID=A0AAN5DGP2_9BILA|nr:hypothetical protein PMAYCL1PPCAC_33064 [Pristionchus mayeri]
MTCHKYHPPRPMYLQSVASNSLVLLNSEPLLDYPRPTVHRVIEIGGIVISAAYEPLDEYWSDVLSRRNRTVIISFGTYIKASAMPETYKATIKRTLSVFNDVTFICKYENPEHNVSHGIENIVVTKWLPQVALLNDPRLTAFITHGGQGSTLEAAYAGIPMLMVPTQGDQLRNDAMIKRVGLGDIVSLSDLENGNRTTKSQGETRSRDAEGPSVYCQRETRAQLGISRKVRPSANARSRGNEDRLRPLLPNRCVPIPRICLTSDSGIDRPLLCCQLSLLLQKEEMRCSEAGIGHNLIVF